MKASFIICNLTHNLFWDGDTWVSGVWKADKFETKDQAIECIKNNEQDDNFSGYVLTIMEIFNL